MKNGEETIIDHFITVIINQIVFIIMAYHKTGLKRNVRINIAFSLFL